MPIYRDWPNQDGVYCECRNEGSKQVTVGLSGAMEEIGAMQQTLFIFGGLVLLIIFIEGMKR